MSTPQGWDEEDHQMLHRLLASDSLTPEQREMVRRVTPEEMRAWRNRHPDTAREFKIHDWMQDLLGAGIERFNRDLDPSKGVQPLARVKVDELPAHAKRNVAKFVERGVDRGIELLGSGRGTTTHIGLLRDTIESTDRTALTTSIVDGSYAAATRILPELTSKFKYPTYSHPAGFRSYRWLEKIMPICVLDLATRIVEQGVDVAMHSVTSIVYGVILALFENRFPLYYVGRDLARALWETDLPEGITMGDVHWSHPAVTFMLPENTFVSPGGSEVFALSLCRYERGQKRYPPKFPLEHLLPYIEGPNNADGAIGVWAAIFDHHLDTDEHRAHCIVKNCVPRSDYVVAHWSFDAPLQKVMNIVHRGVVRGTTNGSIVMPDIGDVDSEEWMDLLPRFGLNLLLALAEKPEIVEAARPLKRVKMKGTTGKVQTYEPRWIGRRYTLRRDHEPQGGTHASPRVHWRRGHWRDVRFGRLKDDAGQTLMKEQRPTRRLWIEPVLVNAKDDA